MTNASILWYTSQMTEKMIDHRKITDYGDLEADYGTIDVPMKFMHEIHDKGYVYGISQSKEDKAIIKFLIEDIPINGLLKPGLLEYHIMII